MDGGEQVEEHQGRYGRRDQELAAKHNAENKMKNENVRGLEMFIDIGEENAENSMRKTKHAIKEDEDIKIKIRKEAEKLKHSMYVSSSSSSEYCIYNTRERSAYLAEESRRTVGLWSSTTASLACSSTPPSSPSTSVLAVASRTPFLG